MYELGYDLLADDDGIIQEAEKLYQKVDLFEQYLGNLVMMLESTVEDAVIHGAVATNLGIFLGEVRNLQTEAGDIAAKVKETVNGYVSEIDVADNYIY